MCPTGRCCRAGCHWQGIAERVTREYRVHASSVQAFEAEEAGVGVGQCASPDSVAELRSAIDNGLWIHLSPQLLEAPCGARHRPRAWQDASLGDLPNPKSDPVSMRRQERRKRSEGKSGCLAHQRWALPGPRKLQVHRAAGIAVGTPTGHADIEAQLPWGSIGLVALAGHRQHSQHASMAEVDPELLQVRSPDPALRQRAAARPAEGWQFLVACAIAVAGWLPICIAEGSVGKRCQR
mmetsp:Transcript_24465/g.76216  ORF Transcript_24465/g.76216 Transcript_24465/m.76216 type:complete len:237 (+) Transcript_24465:652-1362(+)